MADTLSLMQEKEKVFQEQKALMKIASQVAHDIRSPLAALKSFAKMITQLSEDERFLLRTAIQRIEDIANDLSQKKPMSQENVGADSQNDSVGAGSKPAQGDIYLLSSLIEPLISEKRLQHRLKLEIEIRSDLNESSYGLFAKVNAKEFKRVLSNLINNAVEAFGPTDPEQGEKGQIIVSLHDVGANPCIRPPVGATTIRQSVGARCDVPLQDDMVQIQIQDNGRGIPPDILPKLMERGASFGKEKEKESGSGLGLYHAKTTLQTWGGDLKIESKTNHGTTVTILLKKESAPSWFVSEIHLQDGQTVIAIDDDNSIHEIWNERLGRYIKDKTIQIHHLADPDALREYVGARSPRPGEETSPLHVHPSHVLFLCDYEFLGHTQTGLDIIEELNIAGQSVLVTSRYEEEPVRERCAKLGIKLIPKPLAGFVPVRKVIG